MLQDKLNRHVKITAEDLSEMREDKNEALKEAATWTAAETQKAIKEVRAKSEALQKSIINEAKDLTQEVNKTADKVTKNIKESAK